MASVIQILPASLPVPAAAGGVSAAVDVRDVGGNLTAFLNASDGDVVAIDGSPDGATLWTPFMVAQNNVTVRQPPGVVVGFIRVRRIRVDPTPGGGPTAPNLSLTGQPVPSGYTFGQVALPVPAADGVGAAVSVVQLGITNEVSQSPTKALAVSDFDNGDQLIVEGSTDGNAPWVSAMQLQPLSLQPFPGSFGFLRVRRQRIPAAGPRVGVDGATAAFMGQGVAAAGGGTVDVTTFGALGNGVTDDTAAIAAAIAAARASASPKGGVVVFPPGIFPYSAQLNLSDAKNVTLRGASGFGLGTPAPASTLKYTGTGAGSAINAQSAFGVMITDLGLTYSNALFTGVLVDFSHSALTFDAAFNQIINCYLGAHNQANLSSCAALVSLDNAVVGSVRSCHFLGAAVGVRFRSVNTNYSNAHNIENCTFQDMATAAIMNAGQQCSIQHCTFENNPIIGAPTMTPAYADNLAAEGGSENNWCFALDFSFNWVGDGDDTAYLFDNGNTRIHGLTMLGNVLGSGGNGTKGLHLGPIDAGIIQGNAIEGAIVFYPATAFAGLVIVGNERVGNTPGWSNIPSTGVTIFANPYYSGGNPQDDVLLLGGNGNLFAPFITAAVVAANDSLGRNLLITSGSAGPIVAANGKASGQAKYTAADAVPAVGAFAAGPPGLTIIGSGAGGAATATAGGTASNAGTITAKPAQSGAGAAATNGPAPGAALNLNGGDAGAFNGFGNAQGGHIVARGGVGSNGGGSGNVILGDANTTQVQVGANGGADIDLRGKLILAIPLKANATIASAATIAPTLPITHITGVTTIQTITPPASFAQANSGGKITLIFDGVAAWNAAGNIFVAGTPTTAGTAVDFTYDNATAKWYPSRLA